jgi:hypothetical protein
VREERVCERKQYDEWCKIYKKIYGAFRGKSDVMMTCFCESYYDLMKEFKGYR